MLLKLNFFVFICLNIVVFITSSIYGENVNELENDAIVITALAPSISNALISLKNDEESSKSKSRQKRQYGTDYISFLASSPHASACITTRGAIGRCLTLKQCYPYFKLSILSQYHDNVMLTMQDTCTFMAPSGKQNMGVCCSDYRYIIDPSEISLYPSFYPDPDSETLPFYSPQFPPPNWPPPIPTHPPDHTIPPLPTHPPRPAYPSTSMTTTKPTTGKWPSAIPSKPTWTTTSTKFTTTPAPDAEDLPNSSECGIKNGYQDQERIVGGQDAELGEWPWMAAILTNGRLFCGGSLIDKTHVLTAAHCVSHLNPFEVAKLRVNLGDYNIKSKADVQHVEKRVKKVVRHRFYNSNTLYNDIALLTLDSPVTYTKYIRPICLPTGKSMYEGRTATVIGWGSINERGPTPSILQKVTIPVWSNKQCENRYGVAAPGGIIDSFLCAGKAKRDSCSGDSGGPLMVSEGKWQQIGIVSWGIGCGKGQFPGVYTRISSFMPWIQKNLKT